MNYQILVVFEKKLDVKKFQNFEILNPVIGICEGTLMGLQILPLKLSAQNLVVFEIWRFLGLSQNFSDNLGINFFYKTWNYHLCSETLSGYSQELWISPPNMTAQNFAAFPVWLFVIFLKFMKIELIFFSKFEIPDL